MEKYHLTFGIKYLEMTDKKDTPQWWDHYCPDAQELLRFNKKKIVISAMKNTQATKKKELRSKLPPDYWFKILGNKNEF